MTSNLAVPRQHWFLTTPAAWDRLIFFSKNVCGDKIYRHLKLLSPAGMPPLSGSPPFYISTFPPSRAGYTHLCIQPRLTPNRTATSVMVSQLPCNAPDPLVCVKNWVPIFVATHVGHGLVK